PTQALFLMNGKLLKSRSRDVATRVLAGSQEEAARLGDVWRIVMNRPITPEEQVEAAQFVAGLQQDLASDATIAADERERRAWSELCHALLASNEFLNLL
ncbi:MAG: DUF1553 domain-containing protein, partial [Planctomycetota bacterium]|nr:DUF1553 domain-containing protein [Planctomycetota bacterium]